MIFAVTDIETTGGQPAGNSITEVAVVLTDGRQELDRFHSLIRPDHRIPLHIERLTGIDNEMVEDAPAFEDIADELFSFFEEAAFVAHNVGFDYSFLKAAFSRCGHSLSEKKLCTVRIARTLHPGLRSYSLGALCNAFGVTNHNAHRALSDTLATVELFHRFCASDQEGKITEMIRRSAPEQWLPPAMTVEQFNQLPEAPGVYYFENKKGEYLYIGKSSNVKKRVKQHFTGKMESYRRQEYLKEISTIHATATGSDTIASLIEDAEIRKYRPAHNKAQKRVPKRFGVQVYEDRQGYKRLTVVPATAGSEYLISFSSNLAARDWMLKQAEKYEISLTLCGLTTGGLFLPEPEDCNAKIDQLIEEWSPELHYLILPGPGRCNGEKSFILLRNGQFQGYGFIDDHTKIETLQDLEPFLEKLPVSEVTPSIIREALDKKNASVIEAFELV